MRRRTRVLAVGWVAAALAGSALAAIPSAEKLAGAVADTNAASGRAQPLLLDVSLRVAGGVSKAEGTLATHPTGLARLELLGPSGFVERHLLVGDAYSASRDGEMLPAPHPFLPPVFLLQATSGAALSAALGSFGIRSHEMALGRLGEHDCYVFGGRALGAPEDAPPRPSLWVDMGSFDALRVVRSDGTEYRLGPTRVFDGIRLPAWIEIRNRTLRARLEIEEASEAAAPAAAFHSDWLIDLGSEPDPAAPPAR